VLLDGGLGELQRQLLDVESDQVRLKLVNLQPAIFAPKAEAGSCPGVSVPDVVVRYASGEEIEEPLGGRCAGIGDEAGERVAEFRDSFPKLRQHCGMGAGQHLLDHK